MAISIDQLTQMAQAAGLRGGASPGMVDPDQNPAMNQATGRMMPPPGAMPPAPGGNPMMAAVQAAMQGGGGNSYMPPVSGSDPTALSGPARMMLPDNINNPDDRGMALGVSGRTGPGGDSEWYAMHEANQGVRGNLPVRPTNDYSGYGDEMNPMPEPRQTPKGRTSSGGPVSDEEELADIQNKMGGATGPKSGDPSANGDFPSQSEITALENGEISPKAFDAKWGKGAAAEMLNKSTDNADQYEGDDKY
jgi:hypothetical protein